MCHNQEVSFFSFHIQDQTKWLVDGELGDYCSHVHLSFSERDLAHAHVRILCLQQKPTEKEYPEDEQYRELLQLNGAVHKQGVFLLEENVAARGFWWLLLRINDDEQVEHVVVDTGSQVIYHERIALKVAHFAFPHYDG